MNCRLADSDISVQEMKKTADVAKVNVKLRPTRSNRKASSQPPPETPVSHFSNLEETPPVNLIKYSAPSPVKVRRRSDVLENLDDFVVVPREPSADSLDEHKKITMNNWQYDGCPRPSVSYSWRKVFPIIVCIGVLVLVAVPVFKVIGAFKRELINVQDEMIALKENMECICEGKKPVRAPKVPPQKFNRSEMKKPTAPNLTVECREAVKHLIKEELVTYDSDKTGRTDFALESAGASIYKTVDTENFAGGSGSLFGFINLCEGSHGPRAMIQANNAPGECWAFKGGSGDVIIKLLGPVIIDSVTLEHIPKSISPTGNINTAPKEFAIYGLNDPNNLEDAEFMGQFEYDSEGSPLQTFRILGCQNRDYEYLRFKVLSNHGNQDFTCVYRLRVHGKLLSTCLEEEQQQQQQQQQQTPAQ